MKTRIIYLLFIACFFGSCSDDFLTRDPMDKLVDNPEFWNNEDNVRNVVIGLYDIYFPGYETSWVHSKFFALTNNSESCWNDDAAQETATFYTMNVPSTASAAGWTFTRLRRINIIENRMQEATMKEEAKNHWLGVARFLRAMEYAKQVRRFGDVPWYDKVVQDNDKEALYRPRDPRTFVMDKVLADLEYAMKYVRVNDGVKGLTINNDVVKAFASQILLFEGTWQKYRANNKEFAEKYLKAAKKAAFELMETGRYRLADSYKSLTNSLDLAGNPEIIIYRSYVLGVKTHSLMSYQNEQQESNSPSKDLIDSYLSSNGLPISQAENTLYQGDKNFFVEIANRDPRLYDNIDTTTLVLPGIVGIYATSGYFCNRFVNESIKDQAEGLSNTNATDAPVMRYGEVLLNYIEAAVELADMGKYTLTQNDFDISINVLRDRTSVQMPHVRLNGTSLSVSGVTINDPERDTDVSPLIWEVRRERRVELVYEGKRFDDLRRWNKLKYSDMKLNKKLNLGAWLDKEEFVEWYNSRLKEGETPITLSTLNGIRLDRPGNAGYIKPILDESMLRTYAEKDYLYPLPVDQITLYKEQGIELKQNPGW